MKVFFLGLWFFSSSILVEATTFDHQHSRWNQILKKYVVVKSFATTFQYKSLKDAKEDFKTFHSYLSSLSQVEKKFFDSWSKKHQLAFLINAYNAFTVKLILDNYPVKSIKDLGTLFSSPWKKKLFLLFGKKRSLDYIEHEVIRGNQLKTYREPRIHFAVVCASIGCPALQNKVFTPHNLEILLKKGVTDFLSDTTRNRYNAKKKRFELSKIFDWYADDFKDFYGSVKNFVIPHYAKNPDERNQMKNAKVTYLDYNWNLNE